MLALKSSKISGRCGPQWHVEAAVGRAPVVAEAYRAESRTLGRFSHAFSISNRWSFEGDCDLVAAENGRAHAAET
jgi:hypothetical protein